MELFDNEAFEALFRKENNAGHLTVSCERISQTRQSPWKAAKHRCTRRPKKRVAKSSKPKPKQKVKRKKVPPRKRQDKQQRAMMKLQEAHEKILAKPQPKLWTQAAYHLPGLIPFNGVGSNIQKARRAAALEMISLLRRNLTTEEEFQSKRTLENMLSCKIDKARKHCNWIGKDFRKSLPPDLKEAFSEKGLHNAFFLAWLNLKDKPVELQDEIELMQRVRNISVENGYMPRRRDPEGFCRFYAFGKAVYDYLAYAGNERSDLTKAAAKVEKLIKDAQETSKEEKRDMRRRLQACSDRFCILVGGPEFLCEAGVRMNLSRTIQVLSRTGSLKTADHLRERHNYAWMVLPFIKNSVGRELGPEKDFGLEFCGSGRTRTDIKGSDMDVFLFAKSSSSVSEEMMGKLWASLMGRCRKYNKYGTVLPSHPPALTDFRDKSPKPRPRPHSTALTTSPRGSALRILAKGRANKDVETYDILRCRPDELLPDFLQEPCYNTRGSCQHLANMQENEWFRDRPGLQSGTRLVRYYCSNKYEGVRELAIRHVLLRRLVYQISVEEGFEPPCLDRTGLLTFLAVCSATGSRPGPALEAIGEFSLRSPPEVSGRY